MLLFAACNLNQDPCGLRKRRGGVNDKDSRILTTGKTDSLSEGTGETFVAQSLHLFDFKVARCEPVF